MATNETRDTFSTSDDTELRVGPPEEPQQSRFNLVLYHEGGVSIAELAEGKAVIVGRTAPSDLVINDTSLSRQHAKLEMINADVWIEDLGSRNGTRINADTITRRRITSQDRIILGGVTGYVHVLSPWPSLWEAGCLSHERFMCTLDDEILRARSFRRSLSLLLVRFANDATPEVALALLESLRTKATAAERIGLFTPGIFEILLPELDEAQAKVRAEDILADHPTARVGIGTFGHRAASAEALVQFALTGCQRSTSGVVRIEEKSSPARAQDLVIVGEKMRELRQQVERFAQATIPVLIQGETGSGKEVIATLLHELSARKGHTFRCINCGAIPLTLLESFLFGHEKGAFTGADQRSAGIFEQAHGGTVFLDEIGELPLQAQAALLRVLETRRVSPVGSSQEIDADVRIIAATHKDLEAMARGGQFRSDLLFRLNAVTLRVPPLRERVEEIEPLARVFLERSQSMLVRPVSTIEPGAIELLKQYDWPGNLRELRNTIERAAILADDGVLRSQDLCLRSAGTVVAAPAHDVSVSGLDFKTRVRQFESELIIQALVACGGNQVSAARRLRMPQRTMTNKVKAYGLRKRFDPSSSGEP